MNHKVLIVDDDREALILLEKILRLSDVDVIACDNAHEAYIMAKMEDVDLILLDIMMPDINGLELCKMMRDYPSLSMTPIYFVTAYNSVDIASQVVEAGADGIVNKPIFVEKIQTLLKNSLSARMKTAKRFESAKNRAGAAFAS